MPISTSKPSEIVDKKLRCCPAPLNQAITWLLLWIMIGTLLRCLNLAGKIPWVDEFATIVFSLGNSFKSVPLDRIIDFPELMLPLIPNPNSTVSDTIRLIFTEDQHPPTYFIINHLWLKLFQPQQGLVDLGAARLLSVFCGVLSIPSCYICSYLIFRSVYIAQFSAAITAISPYGIYLAQEARHYTLAGLWVMLSIACLAVACQYIHARRKIPGQLILLWLLINNLGMATHYLFVLAISSETISLLIFLVWHHQNYTAIQCEKETILKITINHLTLNKPNIIWLLFVGINTIASAAIWLSVFRASSIPLLTDWLKSEPLSYWEAIFNPILRLIGYFATIFSMLLVESDKFILALPSLLIMLLFLVWLLRVSWRAIVTYWKIHLHSQAALIALLGFWGSSIVLFLLFPSITKMDITLAPRYQFIYFPAIVLGMGVVLAHYWQSKPTICFGIWPRQIVTTILLFGLLGSLVVAGNQGYLKSYEPVRIVDAIEQTANPLLIATTQNGLTQVGELMSIAWEMKKVRNSNRVSSTQFLLAHQDQLKCSGDNCVATDKLRAIVNSLSTPHDLLLVNFNSPVDLSASCKTDSQFGGKVKGYQYLLFHCDG